MSVRGNVSIYRAQKTIQGDDCRPRWRSRPRSPPLAPIRNFGSPLSGPEPLRVTGPLPSLVLRTEDMWQRYNQCTEYRIQNVIEVSGALNQGFPFSPLLPHFRGLRDGVEYKFLDIPPRHRDGKSQCRFVMVRVSPSHPYTAGRAWCGWMRGLLRRNFAT